MPNGHQQSTDGFLYESPECTTSEARPRTFRHFVLLALLSAILVTSGCKSGGKLPGKSSKEYGDVVSAFYVGLAALQVGDDVHAESRLSEVTKLVPSEPAGWANWGILALRQRNYDAAARRL